MDKVPGGEMLWWKSHSQDPRARELADKHYSRKKPGSPRFVPPGRCVVFITEDADAVWATSWPFAEYVRHAWAGAWVCSIFRNESDHLSSYLITQAVAATRAIYPDVPALGMITFVDPGKTRRKRDPGRCFRKAGFRHVGETKRDKLIALQLSPDDMPPAVSPLGWKQDQLIIGVA